MLFNVSQLLREPIGAERSYPIDGPVPAIEEGAPPDWVTGEARLVRSHRGLIAYATVATSWPDECSRCLEPVQTAVQAAIEEEYIPSVDVNTSAPLPVPDGEGTDFQFFIDAHHHLDLTEAIRQGLEMERAMQPLCRPECAGLCDRCGADLNQGRCACADAPVDLRWEALVALKSEANHRA